MMDGNAVPATRTPAHRAVARRFEAIALPGLPMIAAGDDLAALVLAALARAGAELATGDVLVVAQKIVSKAEGRAVHLHTVRPSPEAHALAARCGKDPRFVQVVLDEATEVLRVGPNLIITCNRQGFVCANAGIDHSNVAPSDRQDDTVLPLPADPDASCRRLRERLQAATGARVAVIVNDSFGRAWRLGQIGTAIGVSGLEPLLDLRGQADLFGRVLRVSEQAVADEIAAAASLLQGQGAEGCPVVLLRGIPLPAGANEAGGARALVRPKEQDLFR